MLPFHFNLGARFGSPHQTQPELDQTPQLELGKGNRSFEIQLTFTENTKWPLLPLPCPAPHRCMKFGEMVAFTEGANPTKLKSGCLP